MQVISQMHWTTLGIALEALQLLVMCQKTTLLYQQLWKPANHLAD